MNQTDVIGWIPQEIDLEICVQKVYQGECLGTISHER